MSEWAIDLIAVALLILGFVFGPPAIEYVVHRQKLWKMDLQAEEILAQRKLDAVQAGGGMPVQREVDRSPAHQFARR